MTPIWTSMINSVTFNEDNSCFTVAHSHGFKVYNSDPVEPWVSRDLGNDGGVSRGQILDRTNYLVLIGSGSPQLPRTKVIVLNDDSQQTSAINFDFPVLNVLVNREFVVCVLENSVYIYTLAPPHELHLKLPTCSNPLGLAALYNKVLVVPGRSAGEIAVIRTSSAPELSDSEWSMGSGGEMFHSVSETWNTGLKEDDGEDREDGDLASSEQSEVSGESVMNESANDDRSSFVSQFSQSSKAFSHLSSQPSSRQSSRPPSVSPSPGLTPFSSAPRSSLSSLPTLPHTLPHSVPLHASTPQGSALQSSTLRDSQEYPLQASQASAPAFQASASQASASISGSQTAPPAAASQESLAQAKTTHTFTPYASRTGSQEVVTLACHRAPLAAIALNGRYVATASKTGTLVRVHDLETGASRLFRRGLDRAHIYSLALSPDNTKLAVLSDKRTLHVFNLGDGVAAGSNSGTASVSNSGSGTVPYGNERHALASVAPHLYFGDEWSFARLKTRSKEPGVLAWTAKDSLVVVRSREQQWEKYVLIGSQLMAEAWRHVR